MYEVSRPSRKQRMLEDKILFFSRGFLEFFSLMLKFSGLRFGKTCSMQHAASNMQMGSKRSERSEIGGSHHAPKMQSDREQRSIVRAADRERGKQLQSLEIPISCEFSRPYPPYHVPAGPILT